VRLITLELIPSEGGLDHSKKGAWAHPCGRDEWWPAIADTRAEGPRAGQRRARKKWGREDSGGKEFPFAGGQKKTAGGTIGAGQHFQLAL